ncbi:MAG: hypothetical protein ABSB35_19710 [Bryobacteraceae bacterium]|jgi:hypothetical protein
MRLSCCTAVLLSGWCCFGQGISIGVVGGVRTTDDIVSDATSESKRYAVGPEVEIGLPFGLGVEVDALYRREGYSSSFSNFAGSNYSQERANSWEFPMLLKYKFPFALIKPFVEGGYAPRVINGTVNNNGFTVNLQTGQQMYGQSHYSTNDASQGLVIGGGVQLSVGRLLISPEVRYTRWNNQPVLVVEPDGPTFGSSQNQVDILVGLSWKLR